MLDYELDPSMQSLTNYEDGNNTANQEVEEEETEDRQVIEDELTKMKQTLEFIKEQEILLLSKITTTDEDKSDKKLV